MALAGLNEEMATTRIFVRLLDEGVECWRPVDAVEERPGCYRIVGPVPETEQWEFQPDQLVRCEIDHEKALVAVGVVN